MPIMWRLRYHHGMKIAVVAAVAGLLLGATAVAQELRGDEHVMLFPSTAHSLVDGRTEARVEAWVYERERRPGAATLLALWLGIDLSDLSPVDRARYDARTQLFRIDSESRRVLRVRFGDSAPIRLPATGSDGRVSAMVMLPGGTIAATEGADRPQWLDYSVVPTVGDPRRFDGRVLRLPANGLSVVSDIDDTIKRTQVRDRREMLLNTFAREFAPVPGMAAWFGRIAAADPAASFHYVSGGPHQLYPALAEFLKVQAFPNGTVHLRSVEVGQEIFRAGNGTHAHKLAVIGQLLKDFPGRRFVLVGDSGEQDPEIYGELARAHPTQIVAIMIRDASGEPTDSPRFAQAMRDLPRERWRVFSVPDDLPSGGF